MATDTIVILAHGINSDCTLPEEARMRVRKGVELFRRGGYACLLMSGKYPARMSSIPLKTEAMAMKDFASKLGVPRSKILVEERSRDTIGNAYFSRLLLRQKGKGKITVITSGYHVKRARFIFHKVYGKHNVRLIGVDANYPVRKMARTRIAEDCSLKLAKDFFKGVRDQDLVSIGRLICTEHSAYSRNPSIDDSKMRELDRLERLRSVQNKP